MNNKGISMITLIITIIVIVILAAIAMVMSADATQKATVAKFKSEFADFSLLTKREYNNRTEKLVMESSTLTQPQIYYMIASGKKYSEVVGKQTEPSGKVSELTVEILGDPLLGNEYYELVDDTNIAGVEKHKNWFLETEKHYVTDKGVAFILPGFLEEEEGVYKWWINERSYYIGEGSVEVEQPENPGENNPDPEPENPEGGNTGGTTPDKFTINGIDIEILGDLMEIEIPEDKNGVQVWPGSVIAYEGDFYAAKYEDYIDKNQRESFIARSAVKLNVDQGALIPGPDTVEGDIKLEGEELYAFRPWGAVGNYEFWTDSNLWLKLLKKPVIDFR